MAITPTEQARRDELQRRALVINGEIHDLVRGLAPSARLIRREGHHFHVLNDPKLGWKIDGVDVFLHYRAEQAGGRDSYHYSTSYNGKLRITVGGEYAYGGDCHRFMEKQGKHDVEKIAQAVVDYAKEYNAKRKHSSDLAAKKALVQSQVQAINRAVRVSADDSEVYAVEDDRQIAIRLPRFNDPEVAREILEGVLRVLGRQPIPVGIEVEDERDERNYPENGGQEGSLA